MSAALIPPAVRNRLKSLRLTARRAVNLLGLGLHHRRSRGAGLDFEFTMAFQPFVEAGTARIFGYEALVRGINGESAGEILGRVNDSNRYRFDQACRVKAIQLASELGLTGMLSINFLPNAIYRPENCIRTTLKAAEKAGFARDRLVRQQSARGDQPDSRPPFTHNRGERIAAHDRHHHVGEHDVDLVRDEVEGRQCLSSVAREEHATSMGLKRVANQIPDVALIVNRKHNCPGEGALVGLDAGDVRGRARG